MAEQIHSERRQGGAADLPCLNRNNSIHTPSTTPDETRLGAHNNLSTAHKKSAAALAWNVQYLADLHSIERIGFLTLTFPDHVTCPKEAQRRFNSLASNVLRSRYAAYIRIFERCLSDRIHYHLLVVLPDDIRTGANFDEIAQGQYTSANKSLKSEWKFWRETSKEYGFGRTELLPIKSTSEGIAKYVGKYIGKSIAQRQQQDKGVRLVEYGKASRVATSKFTFVSEGSAVWRRKIATFAKIVARAHDLPCNDLSHLSQILGSKWAYNNREFILSLPDEQVEPMPQCDTPDKGVGTHAARLRQSVLRGVTRRTLAASSNSNNVIKYRPADQKRHTFFGVGLSCTQQELTHVQPNRLYVFRPMKM
jgi:hypothetical protein